jgi:thioesterase domain-containing protein/acyl carrier protein
MTPPPSDSALRDLLVTRLAARLGVEPGEIDPQETFQSQGLDSSGAVRLIAELSEALGRTLSPTLIGAHPTLEALACFLAGGDAGPAQPALSVATNETIADSRRAELDRRRRELASRRGQLSGDRKALLRKWVGGGGAAPATREAPPEVTPLVKVQTFGTRPPIFLVHAAGGLVHDFVNLAQRLDTDQPFYALQSPAFVGGEHFASVPLMAAHYLEAVRSVQSRGPYRLGGYCVGGTVAFEMARQLRDVGEETENLLLFDSPSPPPEPPPPLDEAALLSSYARTYGNGAEVSADELRAQAPEAWIDLVLERVRETGALDASFDSAQLKQRWEVMKRNTRAILPFVPAGRLPLGAVLFRAVDQSDALRDLPFLGWERWLEGPIEVVDVEGNHLEVFLEPAVEAVARELRDRTAVASAV